MQILSWNDFNVLIFVEFVFFLESLRNVVIGQELRIKELEQSVKQLTEQKKKCERHRKREGKFLESVINKCKGDNVPLSDISCSDFCKRNKVVIIGLCQNIRYNSLTSCGDVTHERRLKSSRAITCHIHINFYPKFLP